MSYNEIEHELLTDPQFNINSICFSMQEVRDRFNEGYKTIVFDDVEMVTHNGDLMTKQHNNQHRHCLICKGVVLDFDSNDEQWFCSDECRKKYKKSIARIKLEIIIVIIALIILIILSELGYL